MKKCVLIAFSNFLIERKTHLLLKLERIKLHSIISRKALLFHLDMKPYSPHAGPASFDTVYHYGLINRGGDRLEGTFTVNIQSKFNNNA